MKNFYENSKQTSKQWSLQDVVVKVGYPYRWYLITTTLLAVVLAADWSFYAYLIKWVLDALDMSRSEGLTVIMLPVTLYFVDAAIASLLFRLIDWIKVRSRPAFEADIGEFLCSYIAGHSHAFYQQHFAGSLTNKINDVARGIPDLCELLIERFVYTFFVFGIALTMLWVMVPSIACIMSIWMILVIISTAYTARHIHDLAEVAAETRSGVTGQITDINSNFFAVRLFSGKKHEKARLHTIWSLWIAESELRNKALLKLCFLQFTVLWLIREFFTIWLVVVGFQRGYITLGDIALVFTIGNAFAMQLWSLNQDVMKMIKILGEVSQGITTLLCPQTVVDAQDAQEIQVTRGAIAFNHVHFSYGQDTPLFSNFSLEIPAGQKIGFVGYSGSGKTTLVTLLLRLFDIESGSITIDNQDISTVTQDSLRKAIALIPQDPGLFHRTLYENIAYGRFDSSPEQVVQAAKQAHADEFIHAIAHGYKALVGDRGVKLSGGQRQRLAIARAFLRNAPILVMDEATSALDSVTENHIQESIELLASGRTTIVIAHRLSTLLAMDRIVLLDQGRIIEDGSHQELLELRGKYWHLWNTQSNGFIPEVPLELIV